MKYRMAEKWTLLNGAYIRAIKEIDSREGGRKAHAYEWVTMFERWKEFQRRVSKRGYYWHYDIVSTSKYMGPSTPYYPE